MCWYSDMYEGDVPMNNKRRKVMIKESRFTCHAVCPKCKTILRMSLEYSSEYANYFKDLKK